VKKSPNQVRKANLAFAVLSSNFFHCFYNALGTLWSIYWRTRSGSQSL